MKKYCKFIFLIFFIVSVFPIVSQVSAHSLFNSAEQAVGGYRVQIATLPEFPQAGETAQLLFKVSDRDFIEVDRFTMGIRVFFNDQQIDSYKPESHQGSHWETDFVFVELGNHIVKVDLYDMPDSDGVLTYIFNISTQSPFGYVFFFAITIGAIILASVIGYIYLPKFFRIRTKP
jgi:hypothetical protein